MQFHLRQKASILITLTALFFFMVSPIAAQSQSNGAGESRSEGQGQPQAQPGFQSGQENAPSFEDSELQKFAEVMKKIQAVQTESNQEIESAFSDSSMSKQRFNSLYQARKSENKQKAADETTAETKEFNKLAKQIQTIQQKSQKQMVETVRNNDMTVQKFNQIVKAMRSNPELGQRIQQMM